ncbi:MAG: hypothetical protein ACSLEN_02215 [Candidatus Malihini olakiniferum]
MKLASFINPETQKKTYWRIDADGIIDLWLCFSYTYADIPAVLRAGMLKELGAVQGAPDFCFEHVTLL